jgi:hypothetical protein
MSFLSLTISPAGVGKLHDLLTCLAKFDENISLEATADRVRLVYFSLSHAMLIFLVSHLQSQFVQVCSCLLRLGFFLFLFQL